MPSALLTHGPSRIGLSVRNPKLQPSPDRGKKVADNWRKNPVSPNERCENLQRNQSMPDGPAKHSIPTLEGGAKALAPDSSETVTDTAGSPHRPPRPPSEGRGLRPSSRELAKTLNSANVGQVFSESSEATVERNLVSGEVPVPPPPPRHSAPPLPARSRKEKPPCLPYTHMDANFALERQVISHENL